MSWLFSSGHAVDVVLAVIVAEAAWLVRRRRAEMIWMLVPGALILLGLRAALMGGPWWQVAAWVSASLPAHVYDLRRRLAHRRV